MPKGQLYSATLAVQAMNSAARVNGTVNGTTVDLDMLDNQFRAALFIVNTSTITDGTHAFKLQDSPDSTTWTDVPAKYVEGGPVSLGAAQSNSAVTLGYLAHGVRYVRLVATTSGATTGGVFSAVAVLGEGSSDPAVRS